MTTRTRVILGVVASFLVLAGALAPAVAETSANLPVETFTLDNGMTFLLVPKPELTTVTAGWVAHVGSANERPGITGISHLFEHMMFKGTHVIGTRNIERDLEIIAEQERIQQQIRKLTEEQKARWRKGEIDDPFAAENRTPELEELQKKFDALAEEQASLMVKNEFDKIYTGEGGSRMNAFTNRDMTVYFITVPANKLELWFWMESDRLAHPVFREFYTERDVVHEERRLRTESTPTGKYQEQFEAMFWESHPYSWPVVGWPSDLRAISKQQADDYYDTYYAPNNLTAAVVGNFDPKEVKRLAQEYFGTIPRGSQDPPQVVTMEMEQLAEKQMIAECDCQPQVEILYHTVPFQHRDSYALDVLAELLNGRTGRLYKSMILDQKIASSASASQQSGKWEGSFSFYGETKGEATPEALVKAWDEQIARLQDEPIPDEELQKVKNQILASSYRRLSSPFFLMLQLLYFDGLGDWQYVNTWTDKTLAVTAEDVKRVANEYFKAENRAVARYYRKAGTEAEEVPPELADLPAPMRQSMLNQIKQVRASTDLERLEKGLEGLQQQKQQVPPQFKAALELMEKTLRQRIEELKSGEQTAEGGE